LSGNERQRKVANVMKLDMTIRGSYLAHVIPIEELVKDIISYHFCSDEDKRKEFISIVLNGSRDYTFASGIEMLKKILNIHYSDVVTRYPKVIDDLDKIRRFRNLLVHSVLDTSDEFVTKNYDDRIRLLVYDDRGKTNPRDITRDEIDERLEDCLSVHFNLVDIRVEIRDRVLT
jgi:hypothetical protein